MQFQSLALLMFAAVLVMGQEEKSQRDRQRQFAASRPRRSAGPARQLVQPTISKHEQQMDIEWPSRAPALSKPVRPQSTRTTVEANVLGQVKGRYIDETGTLQVLEYETGKSAANKSGSFWTSAVLKPFPINTAQSQGGRQRQLAARRLRSLSGPTRQRIQPTITNQEQQVDNELPIRAPALSKPVRPQSTRTSVEAEERPKKPSVETIRANPTQRDGSFTFGYENADGSFKEGTRGPDCVVHGRSGNIEEGGINRGFTYQTGNLCDLNAIPVDEASLEDELVVRAQATRPVNIPRPVISRLVYRFEPARAQPEHPQPERLADERQLIAEENERPRLHPAVGFALVPQSDPPQVSRFIVEEQLPGQFQQ